MKGMTKRVLTRALWELGTKDPDLIRKAVDTLNQAPEPMTFMCTRNSRSERILLMSRRSHDYLQRALTMECEARQEIKDMVRGND